MMSSDSAHNEKPAIITLGEIVVAAGMAGHPVAASWSAFPPNVLTELWRYFAQVAGSERVLHVRSRADAHKLEKATSEYRLVLVHDPRQYPIVGWTIDGRSPGKSGLPSVVFRSPADRLEDAPLPKLVVQNSHHLVGEIAAWLTAPECKRISILHRTVQIVPEDQAKLQARDSCPRDRFQEWRDRQVLVALAHGVCLLRRLKWPAGKLATIDRTDWKFLIQLLRAPGLQTSLSRVL